MNRHRQSWADLGTTPNKEWWAGFRWAYISMLLVMFVTYLLLG